MNYPIDTPWGTPDHCHEKAPGVLLLSTPSHGGFWLDPERNAQVDRRLQRPTGFYEEDCEWAIVAHTFPELFDEAARREAVRALITWFPSEYEAVTNTVLPPGASWKKDRDPFLQQRAGDWIVIAAVSSDRPGLVECVATRGGTRGKPGTEERFLVPETDYQAKGPHGFVIDPERHRSYSGPTSFVAWRPRSRRGTWTSRYAATMAKWGGSVMPPGSIASWVQAGAFASAEPGTSICSPAGTTFPSPSCSRSPTPDPGAARAVSWRNPMADYYAETAVEPAIAVADMTPLERLLLEHLFEVSEEDFRWSLYSAEGPVMHVVVDRADLMRAMEASSQYRDSVAVLAVTAILDGERPATAGEPYVELDLTETSWDLFLQDVVKRSTTLAYLTAVTSFRASKPRCDSLGGMVVLITRDRILGKSTADLLEELLDEAGWPSTPAPG